MATDSTRLLTKGKGGAAVSKCLGVLRKGIPMTKVRGKSKKYQRTFLLDKDLATLRYTGSKKIQFIRNLLNKGPDQSEVPILDIHEIREGVCSDIFIDVFNSRKNRFQADNCFSLVVGDKNRTLDLVASNKQECDMWVKGLRHLMRKYTEADLVTQQTMWIRELFKLADKDDSKYLSLKEIIGLLQHMNINVEEDQVIDLFKQADKSEGKNKKGEDSLSEEEFMEFYHLITQRPEMEELFESYNDEGKYLDTKELQKFIVTEQKQDITEEGAAALIEKYEACPKAKESGKMSLDGFRTLMHSPEMDLFDHSRAKVFQDMSQPMCDYFINSSHNTYLLADQLVGPSATEAYIRALQKGCRCVELDCWDGDDGEPVIYHGYTLTSKILFKDVVEAIDVYAFEATDYPVILSIENHCSVEQQKIMAQHMKWAFKEKLFTEPLPEGTTKLPSPESLKGRIVVKAKRLPPAVDNDEVSDEDEAVDMDDDKAKQVKSKKKNHKLKLAKELSDCVVICQSVSFKGFQHSKENYNFAQMSSFAENKAEDLSSDTPEEWIRHNQWQVSRIYPSGLRTDSSNYDPQPMWNVGCQIVALNYQTPDDPMQWNLGKFLDNGGCGYLLKPDILRNESLMFNPKSKAFPSEWKKKLSLTILSGWQLPKEKGAGKKTILDPYVRVDISGVDMDTQSQKTNYVKNNGFNPSWNETFDFDINVPELALVRFLVKDYDTMSTNELVAQYCLPFMCMQEGYRMIPLQTKYGTDIYGSSLLVHVKIE